MDNKKIRIGIMGATGYAGQQLVALLVRHPHVTIAYISSNSYEGQAFDQVYPHYTKLMEQKLISMDEALGRMAEVDLVFAALPSGAVFEVAKAAMAAGVRLIDLSADFRLKDKAAFEFWYKLAHGAEDLLPEAVYGLPELWRDEIKTARIVANPGCYSTAGILALAPILRNDDLIDPFSVIIDAKSGVTGAGRKEEIALLLAEASESVKAYNIGMHRHTPEIEQEISKVYGDKLNITFTPHLMPMKRGILATCYVNAVTFCTDDDIYSIYERFYGRFPFIRVRREPLETRYVSHTNFCDISIKVDLRARRVVITSAIDNLMKGAAGQAVQNMNIMFDFDETAGLMDQMPIIP